MHRTIRTFKVSWACDMFQVAHGQRLAASGQWRTRPQGHTFPSGSPEITAKTRHTRITFSVPTNDDCLCYNRGRWASTPHFHASAEQWGWVTAVVAVCSGLWGAKCGDIRSGSGTRHLAPHCSGDMSGSRNDRPRSTTVFLMSGHSLLDPVLTVGVARIAHTGPHCCQASSTPPAQCQPVWVQSTGTRTRGPELRPWARHHRRRRGGCHGRMHRPTGAPGDCLALSLNNHQRATVDLFPHLVSHPIFASHTHITKWPSPVSSPSPTTSRARTTSPSSSPRTPMTVSAGDDVQCVNQLADKTFLSRRHRRQAYSSVQGPQGCVQGRVVGRAPHRDHEGCA